MDLVQCKFEFIQNSDQYKVEMDNKVRKYAFPKISTS